MIVLNILILAGLLFIQLFIQLVLDLLLEFALTDAFQLLLFLEQLRIELDKSCPLIILIAVHHVHRFGSLGYERSTTFEEATEY
jgi:hypothetical protein